MHHTVNYCIIYSALQFLEKIFQFLKFTIINIKKNSSIICNVVTISQRENIRYIFQGITDVFSLTRICIESTTDCVSKTTCIETTGYHFRTSSRPFFEPHIKQHAFFQRNSLRQNEIPINKLSLENIFKMGGR